MSGSLPTRSKLTGWQRACLDKFRDAFSLAPDVEFAVVSPRVLDDLDPDAKVYLVAVDRSEYPFVELTLTDDRERLA